MFVDKKTIITKSMIRRLISQRLIWAEETINDLGLHLGEKKDILELGCGIGCLSKKLIDYGHTVVSCDDKKYASREFNIQYDKIVSYFNQPRLHFYYSIPYNKQNRIINNAMFNTLQQQTSNKKFDLILWQAFDLFQLPEMQFKETFYLIKKLHKFLKETGKIIIGYNQAKGYFKDKEFELSKSYRWLQKWRTNNYKEMGYYVWSINSKSLWLSNQDRIPKAN